MIALYIMTSCSYYIQQIANFQLLKIDMYKYKRLKKKRTWDENTLTYFSYSFKSNTTCIGMTINTISNAHYMYVNSNIVVI